MNEGFKSGMTDSAPSSLVSGVLVVNTSQTFIAPTSILEVEGCGGGAGGRAGDSGGASAGYFYKRFENLTPGTVVTIVIGANGIGAGNNNAPPATAGGQTTVSVPGFTILSANGGGIVPSTGGVASGGDININGQPGNVGTYSGSGANFNGGLGAASMIGLGGTGGAGGGSAGSAGTGAGSGGGGGYRDATGGVDNAGGNGTAGRVILRWSTQ